MCQVVRLTVRAATHGKYAHGGIRPMVNMRTTDGKYAQPWSLTGGKYAHGGTRLRVNMRTTEGKYAQPGIRQIGARQGNPAAEAGGFLATESEGVAVWGGLGFVVHVGLVETP